MHIESCCENTASSKPFNPSGLKISPPPFIENIFSSYIIDSDYGFPSSIPPYISPKVCVFVDPHRFIHFLFKERYHFRKGFFKKSFSWASSMWQCPGPAVVGLLGFNRDIVLAVIDCVLLIDGPLGIWVLGRL